MGNMVFPGQMTIFDVIKPHRVVVQPRQVSADFEAGPGAVERRQQTWWSWACQDCPAGTVGELGCSWAAGAAGQAAWHIAQTWRPCA